MLRELRSTGSDNDSANGENARLRRHFASYFPRKAVVDARQETYPITQLHPPTLSDLPDPLFNYRYLFDSPQMDGIPGDAGNNQEDVLTAIRGGENPDDPGFSLTPGMNLRDMMHPEDLAASAFQIFSDSASAMGGTADGPR